MTPPVVLLHGWGGSFASTWTRNGWAEALGAAGRTIIEMDLPGHGRVSESADPASYANLAGAVAARLPSGPVDVVGYSLGGKIALALAAMGHASVRQLVVAGVGDNLFAPEPGGEMIAAALETPDPAGQPPAIAALVRYASEGGGDPRALAAVLRRAPNPVIAERDLAGVKEVLLVNGDADVIAYPDARLRSALQKPNHRLLVGVDHLSIPANREFRDAALTFLKRGNLDC